MPASPKIGSHEYYQRLYEVEEKHWWSRGVRDIASRILRAHYDGVKGLDVLDAGCGTGMTLSWLKADCLPKQVIGIDNSSHALRFCQKRGDSLLCQASVLELPFKSDCFDLVMCNDVMQHLPGNESDKRALREFHRALKPGGCLFVRTNSSQGLSRTKSPENADYRTYSLDELRDKVQQAGFHTLKATYAHTLLAIFPILKRYLKHAKTGPPNDQGLTIRLLPPHLQWLNALLYRVMKSEAWFLAGASRTWPFGLSIFFLVQKPKPHLH